VLCLVIKKSGYRGRFLKQWSWGVALSPTQASSFAQGVKNVSITERPSLGQAALQLWAAPQLNLLRTGHRSVENHFASSVFLYCLFPSILIQCHHKGNTKQSDVPLCFTYICRELHPSTHPGWVAPTPLCFPSLFEFFKMEILIGL
jgi:hypothetical protein